MPLLIGIILLAFGISLAVAAWSPAFVAALQVFAVVTLLFCGTILTLVGYSAQKAKREYTNAESSDAKPSDSGESSRKTAARETREREACAEIVANSPSDV